MREPTTHSLVFDAQGVGFCSGLIGGRYLQIAPACGALMGWRSRPGR
jgi:hypothetical protein